MVEKKYSVKDPVVSKFRTICEVHRELYEKIIGSNLNKEEKNKMVNLLEEAYEMGKKMNNKLRQYKFNYDDAWWEKNKTYGEKLKEMKKRGK